MDITDQVIAAAADGSTELELFRNLYLLGLVRLNMVDDPSYTFADLCGDTYNPEVNTDIDPAQLAKEKAAFRRRVNREGVHGVLLEVRTSPAAEWEGVPGNVVDSIWGFVGLDFLGSGYEGDMIQAAIDWAADNVAPGYIRRCADLVEKLFNVLSEKGV